MIEGLRGVEDGIVYFGDSKKEGGKETKVVNDFLLPV
jgi:hypothetical protein